MMEYRAWFRGMLLRSVSLTGCSRLKIQTFKNHAKKSNKYKVYVDGQELAQYRNEKEARKNAKELIKLLGEDLSEFIEEVLDEPKIEDTLGFSNGLKGNQTYNDVAEKIATIK